MLQQKVVRNPENVARFKLFCREIVKLLLELASISVLENISGIKEAELPKFPQNFSLPSVLWGVPILTRTRGVGGLRMKTHKVDERTVC